MNENEAPKVSRRPRKNVSLEEKRNYYTAWEKSGMNQIDFCRMHKISKSALCAWGKEFKEENNKLGFSPIVLKKQSLPKKTNITQLNIGFSNRMQLSMEIAENRLVSFIQELAHAVAVIR